MKPAELSPEILAAEQKKLAGIVARRKQREIRQQAKQQDAEVQP